MAVAMVFLLDAEVFDRFEQPGHALAVALGAGGVEQTGQRAASPKLRQL